MTRQELQIKAANILTERKRFICQWATGVGKSGSVLEFLKIHPNASTLIFVPEQNNIQNWYDEFDKFDVFSDNVTIACYASMHKYRDTEWDLLVFDEMPHLDTDKRVNISRDISAKYVLALGAVITDDEKQTLEDLYGNFLVWRINLHQAIAWGLIPMPTVNVMHMELDDTERNHYYQGRMLTAKQYYDIIQKKVH